MSCIVFTDCGFGLFLLPIIYPGASMIGRPALFWSKAIIQAQSYVDAFRGYKDNLPTNIFPIFTFYHFLPVNIDDIYLVFLFIYKTHFWNHALKPRFLFSKKCVFLQTTLLETTLKNTLLLNKKRVFKAWFQKCVL